MNTIKIRTLRIGLLTANRLNNKQIDASFLCFCPVIDHDFRHSIVKVAVDPGGDS